jgi:hypothetical protein
MLLLFDSYHQPNRLTNQTKFTTEKECLYELKLPNPITWARLANKRVPEAEE